MFGAFKPSPVSLGGLLWKVPYRMSDMRKGRARFRLRAVDSVIEQVKSTGIVTKSLNTHLTLPTESEMTAKDKYTVFSRKEKNYRKGIHKTPLWTKTTHRTNPGGF